MGDSDARTPSGPGRVDAAQQRRGPLTLAVSGHPGTGRDTMAAALTTCFGVRCLGPQTSWEDRSGADLLVHVLGAQVRACDREFLAQVHTPVLVVAGKADLRGTAAAAPTVAAALATHAVQTLQRPVYPVSALLAGARIDPRLWADLRRWSAAQVTVPPLAVAFTEHPEDDERRRRTLAFAALGPTGLAAGLTHAAGGSDTGPQTLTALLRARSGFRALIAPIRAHGPTIAANRQRRYRRALTLLAAAGEQRDRLETELQQGVRG
ncbi:hypothetical protein GOHSU_70_00020 [Gordonia hirsuta DSM 44140 = NBRC 16056]|uniref:Uncharacterized protein n=1 Tax=Gordonia hirsuta DSM 44140 = NBRC 16056 TaxID=1121927 RepID=L7LD32_9ACTN|nr:hypothetical protein [Gordonia hirsuta]GAC59025.1 hypothetical protein GOHSU_70_00020 [Gordonia hirsuta DSM 44140 = NBRC 16056]